MFYWDWNVLCWQGYEAWRVVKHVSGWCFRGIYNGGLREDDLSLPFLPVRTVNDRLSCDRLNWVFVKAVSCFNFGSFRANYRKRRVHRYTSNRNIVNKMQHSYNDPVWSSG